MPWVPLHLTLTLSLKLPLPLSLALSRWMKQDGPLAAGDG